MTRKSDEVKKGLKRIVLNRRVWVFLMTMMMIVGPLPIERTQAATLTVDRTDDDASATACTGAANDCSLRGAIIAANTMVGADTIMVPAGTYTLTIAGQLDDAALMGDLDLTESLTIKGAGQASTIIQAGPTSPLPPSPSCTSACIDRVFHIVSSGVTAEFMDLTIRHGRPFDGRGGGGIYNDHGTVTITNSTVSNNIIRTSDSGGGIYNDGGTVSIINSTVSNNRSDRSGGGIVNIDGTVTITNSTVSNNRTSSSLGSGGGISSIGWLTIINSTVSNNQGLVGGGIANAFGTATIINSTVLNNSAFEGGGIANTAGGTITIKNSIVANSPAGGDCANNNGAFTGVGKNFDTDGSCASLDPNLMQVTPAQLNLGPLQLNAPGTTATHALQAGSVAMNAVTDCTDLQTPTPQPVTTDQRGVTRPQGGSCDVGAYEAQAQTQSATMFTLQGAGVCLTLDLMTRQYSFKTPRGTFTGPLVVSQRRSTLFFENGRGDNKLMRAMINLSTRAGSAALILPRLLGGQRYIINDANIADTGPCP